MKRTKPPIPLSVVRRFPQYFAHAQRQRESGVAWVSSRDLAEALGLTSSTVRQDLSHLDFSGISKRGYSTEGLADTLAEVLGATRDSRMAIVGAGNLGRALALHGEFGSQGFRTCGIFDADPRVIGKRVGGLEVQAMEKLADVVRAERIDIGIIAVPAASAQEVADRLVVCGVRGLLNLAHVHVRAPRRVVVVETRIAASLQELAYAIGANPYALTALR